MVGDMSSAKPQDDLSSGENFVDELKPGTELLHGQYRIESFLNAGGFGITYLARDSLDRKIVIKECFPGAFCRRSRLLVQARSRAHQNELDSIVRLFVQEARSLAKLEHPNIVGVHQVFEDNNTAYMALDFVEGDDLLDVMDDPAWDLQPSEIKDMLRKLLGAISFIHKEGMLHRDISPDNILIDAQRNPILIDFGAAREQASKQSRVLSALRVVKDGYSPQEFYIAGSEQGPSSDLYALGASFYHIITGELPPNSQNRLAAIASGEMDPYQPVVGRVDGYDENFLTAIDRAMAVLPKDRTQSAEEWLAIMDGRPIDGTAAPVAAAAVAPVAAAPKKTEKKKSSMGVILGSVALLALGAGGAAYYTGVLDTAPSQSEIEAAAAAEAEAARQAAAQAERQVALEADRERLQAEAERQAGLAAAAAEREREALAEVERQRLAARQEAEQLQAASEAERARLIAEAAERERLIAEAVAKAQEEAEARIAAEAEARAAAAAAAAALEAEAVERERLIEEAAARIRAEAEAEVQAAAEAAAAAREAEAAERTRLIEEAAAKARAEAEAEGQAAAEAAAAKARAEAEAEAQAAAEAAAAKARAEANAAAEVAAARAAQQAQTNAAVENADDGVVISRAARIAVEGRVERRLVDNSPQPSVAAELGAALRGDDAAEIPGAEVAGANDAPVAAPNLPQLGVSTDSDQLGIDVAALQPAETPQRPEARPNPITTPVEPPVPIVQDVTSVMSAWSVDLPFEASDQDSGVIGNATGELPAGLSEGQRLVSVNGLPVDRISDVVGILRQTVEPGDTARLQISLGAADEASGTVTEQDVLLPLVQETALLNGMQFRTEFVAGEWQTKVVSVPPSLANDIQAGDQVFAYIPTGEFVDGRTTLKDILDRELANGVEQFSFAVRRDGAMWVGAIELSSNDD